MLGLFTAKLFSIYISSEDIIKMVRITVFSLNPDSKAPVPIWEGSLSA